MTMHYINSVSGNGSSGGLTISGIPSNFTHLHLRGVARSTTTASQLYIRVNNDANNNYYTHYIYGTGSTAVGGTGSVPWSVMLAGTLIASTAPSNSYTGLMLDIPDYAGTSKLKTMKSVCGYDANGSGESWMSSGVWNNTAAINSISIVCNTIFDSNTRFDLYGITSNPLATGA